MLTCCYKMYLTWGKKKNKPITFQDVTLILSTWGSESVIQLQTAQITPTCRR